VCSIHMVYGGMRCMGVRYTTPFATWYTRCMGVCHCMVCHEQCMVYRVYGCLVYLVCHEGWMVYGVYSIHMVYEGMGCMGVWYTTPFATWCTGCMGVWYVTTGVWEYVAKGVWYTGDQDPLFNE